MRETRIGKCPHRARGGFQSSVRNAIAELRRQPICGMAIAALCALTVPAAATAQAAGTRARAASLLAAMPDVEAGRRTTPLIGEPTAGGNVVVTFLAKRGGGAVPRVVSDVTGWGERPDGTFDVTAGTMTRAGKTDWYVLETTVAGGARIEYLIAHGLRDYRPDPYNPRRTAIRGMSPASEFVTPGYVPPPEFEDPPAAPAGRAEEASLDSQALGGPRSVIVYTPPGYRKDGRYPLAVFHGGIHVARTGVGSRVLDWLITRQTIEPIVALFVDSWPRDDDENAASHLRTFLSDELLTWAASRSSVTADPGKRALLAISYGAKDALEVAVSTRAFGRLGLLIPGRRLSPEDTRVLAGERGPRLEVAILAGLYDGPNLATARRARQSLADAGHAVDYIEVPEGHNQGTWRNHLRDVLVSLFGKNRPRS